MDEFERVRPMVHLLHGKQSVLVQEHMLEAAHFMTFQKQSQRGRGQGETHSAKTHPSSTVPPSSIPRRIQNASCPHPEPFYITSMSLCYSSEFKCFLMAQQLGSHPRSY